MVCKMPVAVETNQMAMTQPEPRRPAESADAVPKIDWSAVLAQHDRWLRTVVAARLGEPQAIDEVMREVRLAAIAQRAPLADATKVAPWLYRLAVMQSLLFRRRQGRRRKLTDNYARRVVEQNSRQVDPLSWLLAEERRGLVRTAMARLAHRDAEILMLKYSEEWSYRDLAHHLGISESAVEARLHRARQRLRAELAALNVVEVET